MTETLPALIDARPEIARLAEDDRPNVLAELDRVIRSTAGAPGPLVDQLAGLYREVALRQTDAGWWLNHVSRGGAKLARDVQGLFTAEDRARLAALAAQH